MSDTEQEVVLTPEEQAAEAEADKLFDEYAKKADARLNDEPVPASTEVDADAQDTAAEVADNRPAAEATQEEAQAQPAAPVKPSEPKAAAAAPEQEPEWLDALPNDKARDAARAALAEAAELRAKNAALEQNYRSVSGRVSAYQSRYEDLKKQLPQQAQAAVVAAEKVETSAEWTDFATQYPDVAKAIESRFPKQAGQDPTVSEIASWVNEQRAEKFLTEAYETVEAVHPGWRDVCRTEEFKAWKASSTTYEKLAASDDVADAIALLDLYEALHPAVAAAKPDATAVAATDKVAARRAAQVAAARTPRTERAAPNQNLDMNDSDQLFSFYANKANERMKARNR